MNDFFELSRPFKVTSILSDHDDKIKAKYGVDLFRIYEQVRQFVCCQTCAQKHADYLNLLYPYLHKKVSIEWCDDDYILKECYTCKEPLSTEVIVEHSFGFVNEIEEWKLCKEYIDKIEDLKLEYLSRIDRLREKSEGVICQKN